MGYFLKRNWLADAREIEYYLLIFSVVLLIRASDMNVMPRETGFQ
jgi:hypothetical protein